MFVQSTISVLVGTGRSWRPSLTWQSYVVNGMAVVKLQVKNVSWPLPLIAAYGGGSPEIVYVTAPFSINRAWHLEAITSVALVRPAVHEYVRLPVHEIALFDRHGAGVDGKHRRGDVDVYRPRAPCLFRRSRRSPSR